MALVKKALRRVLVDGVEYGWTIRHSPTYAQDCEGAAMTLAVERTAARAGRVLHVTLGVSRPDSALAPHQTAVTPKMVREMIAGALAAGWNPNEPGGAFEYVYPLIRDRA